LFLEGKCIASEADCEAKNMPKIEAYILSLNIRPKVVL
jgi:hypothetical protein